MSANRRPTSISPGRRLLLLAGAVIVLMGLLASNAATHTRDLDCSDFAFQTAAQDHRDVHLGDPDRLDDDDDGTTCEELPCPCGATPLPPVTPIPARSPPATVPAPLTTTARVDDVIDGRTLKVRLPAGEIVDVALIGIDSPQTGRPGSRGECAALDATARMRKLAFGNATGPIVRLQTDPTQDRVDRSDRLLVYVSARGVDFGRTMIASGLAKVHGSERDFVRLTSYRKAQASAKAAKRGVWRRCGGH